MKKKLIALTFFVIGIKLIVLFGLFSITGGVIDDGSNLTSSISSIIGLVLIGFSLFLFAQR